MKQESSKRMRRGLPLVLGAIYALALLMGARASNDYYQCYQFGTCAEPTLSNDSSCRPVTDYDVTVSNKNSPVTVLSLHGGNIEASTSGISNALSNLYGWSRYDFNAHATSACTSVGTYEGNKLHITSTNFNDPRAVNLVSAQPKAVAIHGYADSRGYDKGVICVGGKDGAARSAFISYVTNNAAAWNANPNTYSLWPIDATAAATGTDCGDDEIRGIADDNLVNRTSSHAGLQLELSKASRADLTNTSSSYNDLRNLIYGAIREAMVSETNCVTVDSTGAPWQNRALASNQAGTFTTEMDATPQATNIDAGVGLSNGAQVQFTGLACIVRFNSQGKIDARNGGAYAALSQIPYSPNTSYHLRFLVNVPAHTYSVYVTPAGGSEQTVGINYAFRTEQATVSSLNNWSLFSDAGSMRVCNFTISGSQTLFQDSFTGTDGLITNEYAHWNSDGINSPDWDMTSGSLFRQGNTAWSGVPDSIDPNKFSSDHTDSDKFRLTTRRTFGGNVKVSLALKSNNDIHDSNCGAAGNDTCWHGAHIWLRYLSQYDLYSVSLIRADNKVIIKRKVPCGGDNGGLYKELAEITHAWSIGVWRHFSAMIQTNNDGSVTIRVYDDDIDPNTPFLQATDGGNSNPEWTSGCTTPGRYPTSQYPPLTVAGSVGVRGDFDNFSFDDFKIFSF
jgi:phage replication-related protein YjqB (UPF0714/DUF867 family)